MANVFQATTGYRDPLKAMTLKALEARAKSAADATQTALAPTVIADPLQGAAGMLGVLGAKLNEGRVASAESQGRADLAAAMAGIDMDKGPDMATIAKIAVRDPELAQKMYDQAMATRQANANREDTQAFQAGESALERQARLDMEAKRQEFEGGQNALQRGSTETIAANAQAGENTRTDKTIASQSDLETRREAAASALATQQAGLDTTKEKEKTAIATANIAEAANARLEEGKKLGLQGEQLQRYAATGEMPQAPVIKPADMYTPAEADREVALSRAATQWETEGGPAAISQMSQVNKALELLQTKPGITGFRTGLMEGVANRVLPEGVAQAFTSWYNPDGTIARQAIEEAVQSTMRQVMGPQFTEKEGVGLMSRAFDKTLDPTENVRRAKLLMDRMGEIAKVKQGLVEHRKQHRDFVTYQGGGVDLSKLQELMDTDYGTKNGGGGGGGGGGTGGTPPEIDPIPAGPDDKDGEKGDGSDGLPRIIENGQWVLDVAEWQRRQSQGGQ